MSQRNKTFFEVPNSLLCISTFNTKFKGNVVNEIKDKQRCFIWKSLKNPYPYKNNHELPNKVIHYNDNLGRFKDYIHVRK